mmetsp:Transcript_15290/g.52253  ORF Transcript_15290/g.52253 Transcript_15290/m.52253 type:complete len:243 (+) Transcript_15290:2132-2860(+)
MRCSQQRLARTPQCSEKTLLRALPWPPRPPKEMTVGPRTGTRTPIHSSPPSAPVLSRKLPQPLLLLPQPLLLLPQPQPLLLLPTPAHARAQPEDQTQSRLRATAYPQDALHCCPPAPASPRTLGLVQLAPNLLLQAHQVTALGLNRLPRAVWARTPTPALGAWRTRSCHLHMCPRPPPVWGSARARPPPRRHARLRCCGRCQAHYVSGSPPRRPPRRCRRVAPLGACARWARAAPQRFLVRG